MKKRIQNLFISLALVTYVTGIAMPVAVSAQATKPAVTPAQSTANNGQALEIAPPVIYLNADPGQTIKTQILIRDISNGNLLVNGQINNFVSSGEDGTPKIILDNNAENNAYSMVDWITPLPSLLLIPREIKSMTATITVPKDATPGGHYAVIRFTSVPPSLEGSGVSLSASIGVLVLVTVSGKINESLKVEELSVSRNGKKGSFFESGILVFHERIKNTGNVHVQPKGLVTITDMFGKKLADININQPPGNVLPQSIREFKQTLDKSIIGNKRLFGRYTAKLTATYGTDKKTITATKVFWVIPYKLVGAIIAGLIALFFVLRFMIKRYNKRILDQANKQRRN